LRRPPALIPSRGGTTAAARASAAALARFIRQSRRNAAMPDLAMPRITIAITPMHQGAQGIFESGGRAGAAFFLVELVPANGIEAEVVLECRDERSAAFAARAVAATAAVLGLASAAEGGAIEAFDDDTAAILAANPTPEISLPAGTWRSADDDQDDDSDDDNDDDTDDDEHTRKKNGTA
jgi:hypothetical protein